MGREVLREHYLLGAGGFSPPPAEVCASIGMLIKKAKSKIRISFKAWGYLFG